jgi:hypothetical protein
MDVDDDLVTCNTVTVKRSCSDQTKPASLTDTSVSVHVTC